MSEISQHPQVKEWLEECRKPTTEYTYNSGITRFFKWYTTHLKENNQSTNQPVESYLALTHKEKRHIALIYQKEYEGKPNSVLTVLTALNSFLGYMDMPINFKRKKLKPQRDTTSHVFSTDDLKKMFDTTDTEGKAFLAASTLGWEISAVLELDREQMNSLIARAISEQKEYYYFKATRKKTGVARLGVLNPLIIQWLGKYLQETKGRKPRKRKKNQAAHFRPISNIFDFTESCANRKLRKMAKDARIITTGRVHFHKLRGWVMSCLSHAGFNEWQTKYCIGKAIPISDDTYLQTLQIEIEEKYPQAYELYLNINRPLSDKIIKKIAKSLESRDNELSELKTRMRTLEDSKPALEALLKKVEELENKLKNS